MNISFSLNLYPKVYSFEIPRKQSEKAETPKTQRSWREEEEEEEDDDVEEEEVHIFRSPVISMTIRKFFNTFKLRQEIGNGVAGNCSLVMNEFDSRRQRQMSDCCKEKAGERSEKVITDMNGCAPSKTRKEAKANSKNTSR
ncbi:hypothetical protein RUM43_004018 [Polyplax serrata]|uniref:Uncharacterized protein n=1 Tax=Polyplax serrata TaxID=468196 RepID=A0AAN8SAG3_POLSC